MKKLLIMLLCLALTFALAGCGSSSPAATVDGSAEDVVLDGPDKEESTKNEESPKEEASDLDFDGSSYSDMGAGTIELVNESGSTADMDAIVIYAEDDLMLTQIGMNTMDFDGSLISYIYVDGMELSKEQLGETQTTLDLEDELLEKGSHTVEVVQYEGNDPEGAVVTYKSAKYKVEEM